MAVSDVIVLLKYGPLTDQLANNANCLPIGRSQRERQKGWMEHGSCEGVWSGDPRIERDDRLEIHRARVHVVQRRPLPVGQMGRTLSDGCWHSPSFRPSARHPICSPHSIVPGTAKFPNGLERRESTRSVGCDPPSRTGVRSLSILMSTFAQDRQTDRRTGMAGRHERETDRRIRALPSSRKARDAFFARIESRRGCPAGRGESARPP